MQPIVAPLAALLLGYALGSIPFGILLTRLTGAGDLRTIGSGNIGATNVLRTGRKGLAAATLLLDLRQGHRRPRCWPICCSREPSSSPRSARWLGHLWPVWLRFAGGKGVATYFGIVLGFVLVDALSWLAALAYAATWIGTLLAHPLFLARRARRRRSPRRSRRRCSAASTSPCSSSASPCWSSGSIARISAGSLAGTESRIGRGA